MKKLTVLFIIVSALPLAHAESTIYVGGGFTNPLSKVSIFRKEGDIGKTGAAYQAQYLYRGNPQSRWSWGGEVMHHASAANTLTNVVMDSYYALNIDYRFKLTSTVYQVLGRYNLSRSRRVTPYLMLGVGFAQQELNVDSIYRFSGDTRDSKYLSDNAITFAGSLGFGLDYSLTDRWIVGGELRYVRTGQSTFGDSESYGPSFKGSSAMVSGTMRVGFRFGRS